MLLGCWRTSPPARPNLILISIDTLRADHLGTYGYRFPTSPEIDRWSDRAVVFERAYSTSSWTLPAHASMLTGALPYEHLVERQSQALSEGAELLPELLSPMGYRSGAVVSVVPFLSRKYGFAQGWEVYDDQTAFPRPDAAPGTKSKPWATFVSSPLVVRRAIELVDQFKHAPFFLFLHFFDVHAAYRAPKEYLDLVALPGGARSPVPSSVPRRIELENADEMLRDRAESLAWKYDAEIRWVDSWIGRLFGELEQRGLFDRSVVVLTADHGEEFYEHGDFRHGRNLFDTTLRVPLVVWSPERKLAGARFEAPVSVVDIPATLLAAAGSGRRSHGSGFDLLSLASRSAGASAEREILARLVKPWEDARVDSAIIAGGLKAMFRAPQGTQPAGDLYGLFRLVGDPLERSDLSRSLPRESEVLRRRLEAATRNAATRARIAMSRALATVSEQERAQIESLGYL